MTDAARLATLKMAGIAMEVQLHQSTLAMTSAVMESWNLITELNVTSEPIQEASIKAVLDVKL
jgi:hypothetical protein